MFTSRTRARLAACATLAALGLAASPAAHAQSLTLKSGDVVTVSGAGTVNANLTGTPVTPTTTSYDDSNNNQYAVQTNGTAAFTLGTGGSISSTKTENIGLYANGSGAVTVAGGTITAGSGATGLYANGSGTVTVTGGTFTASGDNSYGLVTNRNRTIDLYGMFDGYALGNTSLPSDSNFGAKGTFTGTLENNTASQTFSYFNFGTITLHNTGIAAAPEPSQFAAFAVGLLGLGALAVKARRRVA